MSTTAPTNVTTVKSRDLATGVSAHRGHDLTRVGAVYVKGNGTVAAGNFEVWYCQNDHTLFQTIGD